MNRTVPISDGVYWVGVNDHETELFENLWPLPHGVAYNSYLIKGEKVALIDGVKGNGLENFRRKVEEVLPNGKIDYLIINHMEPDHSGALPLLLKLFPGLKIVGNRKTAGFLRDFYDINEVTLVEDGQELDLGGHRLKFFLTPMVHWPETMMTFETNRGILFSGDVFGGYGALDGGIFDDDMVDPEGYEDELLRYFSNVLGRYGGMLQKALAKVKPLDISIIAATHGPVWRKAASRVWDLYDRWSRHEVEDGVVIAYASMYGNTARMMETIAATLTARGIDALRIHDVSKSHASYIIADIWRHRAAILGTPTYNTRPFPLMESLVQHLENKMVTGRLAGLFGSCGWSGGGVKALEEFAERMKWPLLAPAVEARGAPSAEDLESCRRLARAIAERMENR